MNKTFIEKLNESDDILEAMMSMPEDANQKLPEMRRKEGFNFLWKHTDMSQKEVIEMVKEREQDFLDQYAHIDVPEWMLRCEAQDVLKQAMHQRLEEEGLL